MAKASYFVILKIRMSAYLPISYFFLFLFLFKASTKRISLRLRISSLINNRNRGIDSVIEQTMAKKMKHRAIYKTKIEDTPIRTRDGKTRVRVRV